MTKLARSLVGVALLVVAHPAPSTLPQAFAADSRAPSSFAWSAPPLAASARNAVAAHFAPTIFQETKDSRDLMVPFDFDGDWDGSNNAAAIRRGDRFPAHAALYFTVAETATHWFVTYVTYHAVDGKSLSGHDHDSEHVTLVVRKDGSPFGRLEAMETRFHKVLYQYGAEGARVGRGADDVDGPIHVGSDGRPEVYSQRVGHGLCGGLAPIAFFDTLSLTCRHGEAPRIARQGVVYRYTGRAEVPRSLDDRDVGYALVEIGESLWAHARTHGAHETFASTMDFAGERCALFDCPRGIGRQFAARPGRLSTGMPWEEGAGRGMKRSGESFFDPAFTLSRRLRFERPFSTGYAWNPYLGVGRFGANQPEAGVALVPRDAPLVAEGASALATGVHAASDPATTDRATANAKPMAATAPTR